MISAPQRRVLSTLMRGASAGMNTVAWMPRAAAAQASAWPWLPEECVTTPATHCAGDSVRAALVAPRNLKLPVRCNVSGFSRTVPPVRSSSSGWRIIGVWTTCSPIRARAARTSS